MSRVKCAFFKIKRWAEGAVTKRCVLVLSPFFLYCKNTEQPPESDKEDEHMALKNLASWNVQTAPAACGAACGAADKHTEEEKKPAACGAGDK